MDNQMPFNLELVDPKLDLIDVDPNGSISAGDCYLVRWMAKPGEILRSWIGVICDDTMLPAEFIATKPVEALADAARFGVKNRDKKYAVWLVGKKEFRWIEVSLIHILNESIRDAFEFSPDWNDFSAVYSIAVEKPPVGYWYWKGMIERAGAENHATKARREVNENPIMADAQGRRKRKRVQDDDNDDDDDDDDDDDATTTLGHGAYFRAHRVSGSSQTINDNDDDGNEKTVHIKKEIPDEDAPPSIEDPLIAVYVGQHNAKFMIRQTALAQSEYLTSLVIIRPNNPQSFITDPDLMAITITDFEHVKTYLESGDYTTKPELHQSGQIYCLAHKFRLDGLKRLVSRTITAAARQVNAKPMLALTAYIFNKMDDQDSLKDWLLTWVAEHFRDLSLRQNAALWQMLDENEDLQVQIFIVKGELMKKEWTAKQAIKIGESDDERLLGTGR